MRDIPKNSAPTSGISQRATNGILVKFTNKELADLDRLAARLGHKRTVAIKRVLAAAVYRSDAEVEDRAVERRAATIERANEESGE